MPCLSKEKQDSCEGVITEKELFQALKSMQNNKSPGNDGLSKEFYENFSEELKKPFMYAIQKSYNIKQLCVSQRQAVIKLVEKKGRDKRFIKNWRPISLLNVDTKLISNVLTERLKNVLPDIISKNQTAYVNNRFISEGGRLINDLLEACDTLNKKGYLVTIDIEKAFDSVNHVFLIAILENFGFGKTFIYWIKILLKNQESCVINGGKTSQYFKLERGTRQGNPISAYLFIIVLEVLFLNIIQNSHIKGIKLFDKKFIYTAYADDTTFFLQNKNSVKMLLEAFHAFSFFSGLKPNKSKCEIARTGLLKRVNVALCGMECVNLEKDTIKILGIHYSYNQALENDQNFTDQIIKIENVLKSWRSRSLNLEGKITVFKSLALSKIIYLALVKTIPNTTVEELNKIPKNFIWNNSKPKIKNCTLSGSYLDGS